MSFQSVGFSFQGVGVLGQDVGVPFKDVRVPSQVVSIQYHTQIVIKLLKLNLYQWSYMAKKGRKTAKNTFFLKKCVYLDLNFAIR